MPYSDLHARYINEEDFLIIEGKGQRISIKVLGENKELCYELYKLINKDRIDHPQFRGE